jgi:hypothetical protein
VGIAEPGDRASIWTSPDGKRWILQPAVSQPGYPTHLDMGVYSDGMRVLAIGSDASQTPGAWISADGLSWQRYSVDGEQLPPSTTFTGGLVGALGVPGVIVSVPTNSTSGGTTWTIWLGTLLPA